MGYATKPANYRTCICGKVCKGGSALATHGRKCAIERTRSAAFLWAIATMEQPLSDAAIVANHDAVARRLTELGYLDAGA